MTFDRWGTSAADEPSDPRCCSPNSAVRVEGALKGALPETGATSYNSRMSRPTTLERAFELARTGQCTNLSEIRATLVAEGLNTQQLDGPLLQKQLRQVCEEAKKTARR